MNEVLEGLPATFTCDMNGILSKNITEKKLSTTVFSMEKRKTLGYDGVPIEFFQNPWSTVGNDFHRMLLNGFENGTLHKGITRRPISLIPNEGDAKDRNY